MHISINNLRIFHVFIKSSALSFEDCVCRAFSQMDVMSAFVVLTSIYTYINSKSKFLPQEISVLISDV